jgi:hypothetical protein
LEEFNEVDGEKYFRYCGPMELLILPNLHSLIENLLATLFLKEFLKKYCQANSFTKIVYPIKAMILF